MPPTEVTFRLSPSYGLLTAHEATEWFLGMMHDHEEFVPHFVACFLRA